MKFAVNIGFLEKNRDTLSSDVIQLMQTSSNKLLKQIFHSELSTTEAKTTTNHTIVTPKNSLRVSQHQLKAIKAIHNRCALSETIHRLKFVTP